MTDEKQESLRARLKRARRRRRLPPREGHEISADGKEVRTPTQGEFFGSLEKALDGPAEKLAHPRAGHNGSDAD